MAEARRTFQQKAKEQRHSPMRPPKQRPTVLNTLLQNQAQEYAENHPYSPRVLEAKNRGLDLSQTLNTSLPDHIRFLTTFKPSSSSSTGDALDNELKTRGLDYAGYSSGSDSEDSSYSRSSATRRRKKKPDPPTDSLIKKRMDALEELRAEMRKYPNCTYSYNKDYNTHTMQVHPDDELRQKEIETHKRKMRTKQGFRVYGNPTRGRVIDAHLQSSIRVLAQPEDAGKYTNSHSLGLDDDDSRPPSATTTTPDLTATVRNSPVQRGASQILKKKKPWARNVGIHGAAFGTTDDDPMANVSVHFSGQGREAELKADRDKEISDWKKRVVVENTAFYVGRNISQTKKAGLHFPSSLVRGEEMLQDVPKTFALVGNLKVRKKMMKKQGLVGMDPSSLSPPVSMFTKPYNESLWEVAHPELADKQYKQQDEQNAKNVRYVKKVNKGRFNTFSQPPTSKFARHLIG